MRVSNTQLSILENLHRYRFLTVKQMIAIGIAKDRYTISRNMQVLTGNKGNKKVFIEAQDFGMLPSIGKLSKIHYLTKQGASLLAEGYQVDESEINHPKGVKIFTRDYFHRVATIDLHILARRFADKYKLEFDFFHTYFEHTGANHSKKANQPKRQALTKVPLKNEKYFIPDCIFQVTDPEEKRWLFTAEIYRNHTTKRTMQQLEKHLYCLQEGAISTLYNYPRAVRVLMLCESKEAMRSLMERTRKNPLFAEAIVYFLFSTPEEIANDFAGNWYFFDGKKTNMFAT